MYLSKDFVKYWEYPVELSPQRRDVKHFQLKKYKTYVMKTTVHTVLSIES